MEQNEKKELGEAARRADAVLRAVAEEQKNEQNRRRMLLHALLDAVLTEERERPGLSLTILDGAAFLSVPGEEAPPQNGGRTAEELARLLLDFCRLAGGAACPPAC